MDSQLHLGTVGTCGITTTFRKSLGTMDSLLHLATVRNCWLTTTFSFSFEFLKSPLHLTRVDHRWLTTTFSYSLELKTKLIFLHGTNVQNKNTKRGHKKGKHCRKFPVRFGFHLPLNKVFTYSCIWRPTIIPHCTGGEPGQPQPIFLFFWYKLRKPPEDSRSVDNPLNEWGAKVLEGFKAKIYEQSAMTVVDTNA